MFNFKQPNFSRRVETVRNMGDVIDAKVKQVFDKRLREKDFVGRPYSEGDVKADLAFVAERREEHRRNETPEKAEMKRLADMFEALVLWNAQMAEWFGSKAITIKTAEYDDYKNGVDMVVEFREDRSALYLGLAADVTFTSDRTVIVKKFALLREEIKQGSLAQVKYFRSEHTHIDGQLSKLPEVIIGVSKGMVLELARLWAEGRNQELANHRIGIMILRQMEAQLETFARYAESVGQKEAAQIYFDRLSLIQGILAEKAELVAKVESTPNTDPVHEEIMGFIKNWNRY